MDVITAVLQARVNTILIFAGIIIVILTLFNLSLSRKTIELRTLRSSNKQIVITAILFGAGLILVGLFFKPEVSAPVTLNTTPGMSVTISSPTPTITPLKPSQTPTITATATQLPTPTSTEVAATPTPPPPIVGIDWKMGCLSTLWIPFPSGESITSSDGCFSGPVGFFKPSDNAVLEFQYQGSANSADTQGLFTKLLENGTTRLDVGLSYLVNGEIWVGIFSEPNITSKGLLLVIPAGDVKNRLILEKEMPDERRIDSTQLISSSNDVYKVEFNISKQLVVARSVNANLDFT
ncbi:MAG TPA: hypothetical protein VLA72_15780, partial [Anaerolineales bacterium]|nr:hypothetical protein [Anaerolineales bacterium]